MEKEENNKIAQKNLKTNIYISLPLKHVIDPIFLKFIVIPKLPCLLLKNIAPLKLNFVYR